VRESSTTWMPPVAMSRKIQGLPANYLSRPTVFLSTRDVWVWIAHFEPWKTPPAPATDFYIVVARRDTSSSFEYAPSGYSRAPHAIQSARSARSRSVGPPAGGIVSEVATRNEIRREKRNTSARELKLTFKGAS
jgi:hypothetical protein